MPRPRVVLDTNVVISAHLNLGGYERFALDLALASKIQLYSSAEILEEYRAVLRRRKFLIHPQLVTASLRLIEKASKLVQPKHQIAAAPDPEDNKFLECAEAAEADYLVTGNKRHFPKRWGTTLVVNARELIEDLVPILKR